MAMPSLVRMLRVPDGLLSSVTWVPHNPPFVASDPPPPPVFTFSPPGQALPDLEAREALAAALAEGGRTVVPISLDQMQAFAGNILELQGGSGERSDGA